MEGLFVALLGQWEQQELNWVATPATHVFGRAPRLGGSDDGGAPNQTREKDQSGGRGCLLEDCSFQPLRLSPVT